MSGKLTGKNLLDFLKNPKIATSAVIYGNDEAVMQKRLHEITSFYTKTNTNIVDIHCKEEKNPASVIENVANSGDFFQPEKLVRIFEITDKIFTAIADKTCIEGVNFVFFNQEINKCPKLRNFHENTDGKYYSIPCYEMEKAEVLSRISQILKENSIEMETTDLLGELASAIGNNPFDIENEMEKIIILTHKSKKLNHCDIGQIINTDEDILSELMHYFFLKDLNGMQKILNYGEVNSVFLSRSIYKYSCKLLTALQNIAGGSNKAQEAKNAGIFFKNVPSFNQHLDKWAAPDLENLIINILIFDKNSRIKGAFSISDIANILANKQIL